MHLRPRLNSLEKNLLPGFIRGTKYGSSGNLLEELERELKIFQ
jgi:hypothetical protein